MSTYQKKKDFSELLPRAFYFVDIEADLEAIQFSYFLDVIRKLTAQFLDNKTEMPR